jgi:hypothetical protein
MDETLRHQRDVSLAALESLIRRGRQILSTRAAEGIRAWQQDCAAAIHQLSGGSKAHWLSRAFSSALLVRSADGVVVVEADAMEIAGRILGVLVQGAASLSRMEDVAVAPASAEAMAGKLGAPPRPRQFEFVHNAELRPVLEQALDDSRIALERGDYGLSLILSCSVIDALLTDALDHARARAQDRDDREGLAHRSLGEGGSFEMRITAAERAGLIRGGCARLPPVARRYRELTDANGELRADARVSAREARLAGQVLRVVMRDLNPGR